MPITYWPQIKSIEGEIDRQDTRFLHAFIDALAKEKLLAGASILMALCNSTPDDAGWDILHDLAKEWK